MMALKNEEFKVKDDDTKYYLSQCMTGEYFVWWYDEDKLRREVDYTPEVVKQHFDVGNWKFVEEVIAKPDAVNHPKHYAVFEQLEAIEVIASSMTTEQFYGYCLGNILKYRLRAGGKDDVMQELGKADKYQELFSKFKPLCQDYV